MATNAAAYGKGLRHILLPNTTAYRAWMGVRSLWHTLPSHSLLLPSWPGAHVGKSPVWLPSPCQSGVAGRPQPSSTAHAGSHLLLQGILKMSLYLLHLHFLLLPPSSSCSQLLLWCALFLSLFSCSLLWSFRHFTNWISQVTNWPSMLS